MSEDVHFRPSNYGLRERCYFFNPVLCKSIQCQDLKERLHDRETSNCDDLAKCTRSKDWCKQYFEMADDATMVVLPFDTDDLLHCVAGRVAYFCPTLVTPDLTVFIIKITRPLASAFYDVNITSIIKNKVRVYYISSSEEKVLLYINDLLKEYSNGT